MGVIINKTITASGFGRYFIIQAPRKTQIHSKLDHSDWWFTACSISNFSSSVNIRFGSIFLAIWYRIRRHFPILMALRICMTCLQQNILHGLVLSFFFSIRYVDVRLTFAVAVKFLTEWQRVHRIVLLITLISWKFTHFCLATSRPISIGTSLLKLLDSFLDCCAVNYKPFFYCCIIFTSFVEAYECILVFSYYLIY